MDKLYDVIIIGSGVVGNAIAREMSRYNLKIGVLEKELDVCNETSARNSGVLHAGFNNKPGTPNYDLFRLALKSTSKRLYPNYCNVDWSGNKGYDRNDPRTYTATMG